MSACVSLVELSAFIARGVTSPDFEAHVSRCDRCASRLRGLAVRAEPASLIRVVPVDQHLRVAMVALAACLAVLLVRTVSVPALPDFAPEGVHGVTNAPVTVLSLDVGPVDSGVR